MDTREKKRSDMEHTGIDGACRDITEQKGHDRDVREQKGHDRDRNKA